MLERWTHAVLRFRLLVLACWLGVLIAALVPAGELPGLLSNSLSIPRTGSQSAQGILAAHFGERTEGLFTVVFRAPDPSKRLMRELNGRLAATTRSVPHAHATALRAEDGIVWADIETGLDLQRAKGYTAKLRSVLDRPGPPRAYLTGQPALQHDLDPILSSDLRRGAALALPVALLLLLTVLGLSAAVLIPFVFAACTIAATLAILYGLAHALALSSYVPNLVGLIGLGLAIDYSLLIVYRFREELAREGSSVEEAVVRTMGTAGRAIAVSGLAVAIGLAVILLMPVPFVRSLGFAGFLVPLVSILAALTLQPALLSLFGRRGMHRVRVLSPRRARGPDRGFWPALARGINRRPAPVLAAGVAALAVAAVPVAYLQLTPGSISAIPQSTQSARGLALLRQRIGPGAITPIEVVIDGGAPGAARSRAVHAASERLVEAVSQQPEAYIVATGHGGAYVDRSGRYRRVFVVGRHEFGNETMQTLVRRLRTRLLPAARFPAASRVHVGGAPAQGVDFLASLYGTFPWVVLTVLALTCVLLVGAFRSLPLALLAVALNLLSAAAAYGLLVVIFRFGVGADTLGLFRIEQVEGWIPVFLFALLFGLSMDYEVFLVMRMRESWEHTRDSAAAIAHGLQRTGTIITAAALIMVAAFSGFIAGRVAGLQELGAGLALAVLIDATLVRLLLLPSAMALLGSRAWWLPGKTPAAASPRVQESRGDS
jgi:putative drug exporter of the RND superfamily